MMYTLQQKYYIFYTYMYVCMYYSNENCGNMQENQRSNKRGYCSFLLYMDIISKGPFEYRLPVLMIIFAPNE